MTKEEKRLNRARKELFVACNRYVDKLGKDPKDLSDPEFSGVEIVVIEAGEEVRKAMADYMEGLKEGGRRPSVHLYLGQQGDVTMKRGKSNDLDAYAKKALETALGEIAEPVGYLGSDAEDGPERGLLDDVYDRLSGDLGRYDLTVKQAQRVLVTALADSVVISLEEQARKKVKKAKKGNRPTLKKILRPIVR